MNLKPFINCFVVVVVVTLMWPVFSTKVFSLIHLFP